MTARQNAGRTLSTPRILIEEMKTPRGLHGNKVADFYGNLDKDIRRLYNITV